MTDADAQQELQDAMVKAYNHTLRQMFGARKVDTDQFDRFDKANIVIRVPSKQPVRYERNPW